MVKNTCNKTTNIIIAIISICVPVIISVIGKITPPVVVHSIDLNFFPKLNASLNTGTTLCLLLGFYFIKIKNIKMHRRSMLTALLLSVMFLMSYIFYHTLKAEDSKFGGIGLIRYIYFFILITHIVLSAIVLPFVLKTFSFAFQGNYKQHKKWAKFTFPLWLYVAITGVLVYLFMKPYY